MKHIHHFMPTTHRTMCGVYQLVQKANLIRIGCIVLFVSSLSILSTGCKSPADLGEPTPVDPTAILPIKVKPSPQDIFINLLRSGSNSPSPLTSKMTLAEYAPFYPLRPPDSTTLSLDTSGAIPILRGKIVLAPIFQNQMDPFRVSLQRMVITIDSMPITGSDVTMDNGQFKIFYRKETTPSSIIDSTEIRSSIIPSDNDEVKFYAWRFTRDKAIGLQFHFRKELGFTIKREFEGIGRIFIRYGR